MKHRLNGCTYLALWLLLSGCSPNTEVLNFDVVNLKTNKKIGTLTISENKYGVVFQPRLTNSKLKAGLHGFHVHSQNSCDDKGKAAGSHYTRTPQEVNHSTSWDDTGHAGDLPNLYVDKQGNATLPVLSAKLKVKEIKGKAIIIHANTDNYTNTPKLGGSGARVGCAMAPT